MTVSPPDSLSLVTIAAVISRNDPDITGQFAQGIEPPRAFMNEFDDALEDQELQGCEYAQESYMLSWTALIQSLEEGGYIARFDGSEDPVMIRDRLIPLATDAGVQLPETRIGHEGDAPCDVLAAFHEALEEQGFALALIDTDEVDTILVAIIPSEDLDELTGLGAEDNQRIHTDYARLRGSV